MRFLRGFASVFGAFFPKGKPTPVRVEPERSGIVGSTLPVARFLTTSGHYSASANRVRGDAFLPNPKDMTTSVFVVDALQAPDVRAIARSVADTSGAGLRMHGAATIFVAPINAQGLSVDYREPPSRHAEISGWPDGPDPDAKAARKKIALELAAAATLSLFPPADE